MKKVEITGINTNELPKLSGQEQAELMKKIQLGDKNARDQFALANMRLVLSVVRRFGARNSSPDDMFQVGCVGLMKAIDNFDVTLDVKFSTYAVPMIIGEIKRYLRDNNAVRVSRSIRDVAYRTLKAREELMKNSSTDPSIDEIAKYLDVPLKEVAIAMDAISDPVSFSDPVYNEGDDTIFLGDQVSDQKISEDNWIESINLKESLKHLDPREKQIVLLRYFVGKTQIEVSEEVGISQAQVSRLEKNAIKALKKGIG